MRVLVCRPREEAEATARALSAAGHDPVVAPVLAIVPWPVSLSTSEAEALVLTSRHAAASLDEAGIDAHRHRPVFAVGAATAAAARQRGFRDVRTASGDAASLPDLVRLTLPAGARITYLAGHVHKPALPDRLRALGYPLDVKESYDAVPAPWAAAVAALLRSRSLQACVHFSRRSASLALKAAAACDGLAAFTDLRHACLSLDVADPLIQAGAADVAVAPQPREASLLQAL